MNRKEFLKYLGILGVASQSGIWFACNDVKTIELPTELSPLNKKQATVLGYVLEILFPSESIGPSIQQLNSLAYIIWNLNDKNRDEDSNNYVIKGIKWVEETAEEEYQSSFLDLSDSKKEKLIDFIAKKNWGEDWLSAVLTLIFESMVYDPVYSVNNNQVAWKWLNHQPGYPRPTEQTKYKAI